MKELHISDFVILNLSGLLDRFEVMWKVMELTAWEKNKGTWETLHTILGTSKTPPHSLRL